MGTLILENISKTFGVNTVVSNVSMQVEEGRLLTVVGPSGCGKTTLLRMIAGLTMPSQGRIWLDGELLVDIPSRKFPVEPERRGIGMVFQSYAVWPHMNVFNNVAYPLKMQKLKKNDIVRKVEQILRTVHMDGLAKRMPNELSGGQQQRVALARALIMEPKLLLLDEPLSNLDAALREEMRGEIKEIQRNMGITIINVTHDQIEAMTMSDAVAVMDNGFLIQYDSPWDLYERPKNSFVAKFIGSANIFPAQRRPSVLADDGGMMEISILGKYSIKVPHLNSPVKNGLAAVRAHHLYPDESSQLTATVRRKLYQGNLIEYHLDVGEETLIKMMTEADFQREPGDRVQISVKKAVWLDE